jgi:hypothetical protein
MQRSTGCDPAADIRGDKKGQFKTDLKFGEHGEDIAAKLVDAMLNGWVEVKSDAFQNGNIFVELAHCPGRVRDDHGDFIWTKSGLNVTQANFWIYMKLSEQGDFRSALVLPTSRLHAYRTWYKERYGTTILPSGSTVSGYMIGNVNGETPTLGLRVIASDIPMIQYSPMFDGKAS